MKGSQNAEQVSHGHAATGRRETGWLPALGFTFLTYNSFTAVYRSAGDPWTVSFVVASYLDLCLLFWCLRALDKTPEGSSFAGARWRLKAEWSLASLLTLMFSYKVAEIMPWPAAGVIWAMAAITVCGGFWGFFVYQDHPVDAEWDKL